MKNYKLRHHTIKPIILLVVLAVAIFCVGCGSEASEKNESAQGKTTGGAVAVADDAATSNGALTTDEAVDAEGLAKDNAKESTKETQKTSSKEKAKTSSTKKDSTSSKSSDTIDVTISIDCKTLYEANPTMANKVSSNGVILAKKTLTLNKNGSVLDALKKSGIRYSDTGTSSASYISAINGLSEKDGGKLSGWMFKVNGTVPMEGCNAYKLKAGDNIQWRYSLESGDDI